MEKAAFTIYLFIITLSPLIFGSVHTYAYTFISFAVLLSIALIVLNNLIMKPKNGMRCFIFPKTCLNFLLFSVLLFLLFQIVPLPEFIMKYLSLESVVVGEKSIYASNISDFYEKRVHLFTVSPYLYPVRLSIIRWIIYGLFFFGLVQTLNSKKRIEIVVFVILLTGCFETLYGIIQSYSGANHIWWYQTGSTLCGTYINRNHYAGFMEMCVVLSVCYGCTLLNEEKFIKQHNLNYSFRLKILNFISNERQINKRIFILFCGVITGIGLVLSASRGGIISVFSALILMLLMFVFTKSNRRKSFIILILFVVTAVYSLHIGIDHTIKRFYYLDISFEERNRMAKKTLDIFKDYKLAGIGVGNFQYAYPKYQSELDKKKFIQYAHNDWVQLLAETGIIGFFLVLTGIIYYLFCTIRLWRKSNDPFAIGLGLAPPAIITTISIHSYSDFNLHIPANCFIVAAIIAIGYSALHTIKHTSKDKTSIKYYAFPLYSEGKLVLLLFLCISFATGFWITKHFMAEINCNTVHNSTLNRDKFPSLEKIQSAIKWDKYNAEYWFKLALNLSRRQSKGEQNDTIEALQEAVHLNPFNARYHMELGRAYSFLQKEPGYYEKWLPAADLSMERAAYFSGEKTPYLHFAIGNYWIMRSKTIDSSSYKQKVLLKKACWHYQKAIDLESGNLKMRMIKFIKKAFKKHYPDDGTVIGEININNK